MLEYTFAAMVSVFSCVIILEQNAIEASEALDMQNSILLILAAEHSD